MTSLSSPFNPLVPIGSLEAYIRHVNQIPILTLDEEKDLTEKLFNSNDLEAAKKREGLADRDDIQTWVDLHDVEEGRPPQGAMTDYQSVISERVARASRVLVKPSRLHEL